MSHDKETWKELCRETTHLTSEINVSKMTIPTRWVFGTATAISGKMPGGFPKCFKTLKPLFPRRSGAALVRFFGGVRRHSEGADPRTRGQAERLARKTRIGHVQIREFLFPGERSCDSAEFAKADALLSEALAWMKNGLAGI